MRYEEGSGTMAGAMLVMVVGIALAVAASVGNLMICQNRARSSPTLSPLTPRMRCGMRISVIHVRSPPTWLKRMV